MAKNQMTPTQRNYAINRMNDIVKTKDQAVRKGCQQQEACSLTLADLAKLIRTGTIKPKMQTDTQLFGHYTYIGDVFDVAACTAHYRPHATYDEKAYAKIMDAIKEHAQNIKNRLMLGDASEALEMINDFESELNGKK